MASEEVISTTTTTYVDEHDDGSITKTEVSATVTKKKQIEYAFQRKSTVVLKADDNDKKYADALDKKEEFAVFIGKVNPLPVTFVRNKSVVKVLGLVGKTFRDGYDEVVFGIYTMREITAIKMAVRKTYIKANDYKFDYQKCFEVDKAKDERWKLIEVCEDVMGVVDEELGRLKKKKEEEGKKEGNADNGEAKIEEDKTKEEEGVKEEVKDDKDKTNEEVKEDTDKEEVKDDKEEVKDDKEEDNDKEQIKEAHHKNSECLIL